MVSKPPPAMAEITRLTLAGKLVEATALIQRTMHGETSGAHSHRAAPTFIDVDFTAPPQSPAIAEFEALVKATSAPVPRSGFGKTLRGLAARARAAIPSIGGTAARRRAAAPGEAGFIWASYTNAAGTRAYKLYVPSGGAAGRRALVIMLHGCTQSPDDFAAGTRMNALAEEMGFYAAYPAQPASANARKCWNWFRPGDQRRDKGEPSLIAGITREIMRDYPVDPSRVYIAGLSAGGAAAAVMGSEYPDLYAAVGVHSGLPCGAARDMRAALDAMRRGATAKDRKTMAVPTIVFHGDEDVIVHPRNGDAVAAQSRGSGTGFQHTAQHARVPGGHAYVRTVYTDAEGGAICEQWTIRGAGHAWAGGAPAGSYTDPRGPDASREMVRFFFSRRLAGPTQSR